jgi:hypothetical protein
MEKKNKKKWIFAIIGIVCICGLISVLSSGSEDDIASPTPTEALKTETQSSTPTRAATFSPSPTVKSSPIFSGDKTDFIQDFKEYWEGREIQYEGCMEYELIDIYYSTEENGDVYLNIVVEVEDDANKHAEAAGCVAGTLARQINEKSYDSGVGPDHVILGYSDKSKNIYSGSGFKWEGVMKFALGNITAEEFFSQYWVYPLQ